MSDNRYYFSFKIPEKFNLLIISDNVAGEFISLALAPSNTINQYWSVKTISPDNLAGVNFFDYNVISFAGETTLSKSYVKRLESFVSRGRSLFVTYNGQSNIDEFNTTWSGMTGVVFDEPVKQDFSRAGYYTLQSIDIVHPIFSVFNFEKNQLPEFKFYTLPKVHLVDDVHTLMRFSGDRPALVENRFGEGQVLTFTGPISPIYSDITGHAFFVPFVSRIAEYLAADLSSYDLRLFAGDNISRPVPIDETFKTSLEMITPDSGVYLMSPQEENNSRILQVQPTDQPGLYSIQYNKREIDRFAVNIDPDECQLDEVTVEDFAVAVGAENYLFLSKNCNLTATIAELRFGKELWQLFLWAVAVLILVEMLLSRRVPSEE